jgi:hypothetical protein
VPASWHSRAVKSSRWDEVALSPNLLSDPLARLAEREACDKKLADLRAEAQRIRMEIADDLADTKRRIASDLADARRRTARDLADAGRQRERGRHLALIGGAVLAIGLSVFFLCAWFGGVLLRQAADDRSAAAYVRKHMDDAELNARKHTFGAHFDIRPEGWFIDFPLGTDLRQMKLRGAPAIWVLPHGH